ncbi:MULTISPECIES: efflux RND transporter permease subunit [unclassified Saccharibacter]|uniref:efflux RND transporter permease subunit n=1 Tax=unclassified Saccharibacter TaxID=2648722 RepID=UPI00132A0AC2|nr:MULTISPECIES: efflux RND transporter permease subunit [unclassified Saccharibacter]MXV37060.1 nodulation protein [Saccharibacter sp. EH611]MXV58450.1 nodulation protein [Saccharibacter sp. EH70]MXV65956.1 nodulation protein [Saccharibacter sp. EH60]
MNFCRFFIDRPVATTLLSIAIFLAGMVALPLLPVATMPDITATAIMVVGSQPGADPQQMATSVTTPLERHLASIADVKTLESVSENGQTTITLEFAPSRNIDGALRDVQAALRASRSDLPKGTLDADPMAFKLDGGNPAYLLHLTSQHSSTAALYDLATIRVRPLLAQVPGVGRVEVFGASTPSVRVELNPYPLYRWGINPEDIRSALASANAYTPKGFITFHGKRVELRTNDQAINSAQYRDLIVGYRNNFNPIYLRDIATLRDDVQDVYQTSSFNNLPAVTIMVMPQPHANTVAIVDGINKRLPTLRASLPGTVDLHVGVDLSRTIRASLVDARLTLVVSILLVVLVIALFFRHAVSTLIPAITVPIALSGALAVMEGFHFSLDILSLMALTVAVGFVVDDAIVVLENIARFMEEGYSRREASIRGASEITFTVLSISLSLIAVFIPLLCIPGTLGSILYEFSMTTIATIVVSMVLSLTLTPMLCAHFLKVSPPNTHSHAPPSNAIQRAVMLLEKSLTGMTNLYGRSVRWSLRHPVLVGLTLPGSFVILIISIALMPKAPMPDLDLAILRGVVTGEPDLSFHALTHRLHEVETIVRQDPAVESVSAFNENSHSGRFFIVLKDKHQRESIPVILQRLHKNVPPRAGAEVMFTALSSSRQGGSANTSGNYRYVLRSDDSGPLYHVTPQLIAALRKSGKLTNLSSDSESQAFSANIVVERDLEARYGVTPQLVQNALYDAYGQAITSTIHLPLTNHRVVMVVADQFRQNPRLLHHLWLSTSAGTAAGGIASNLIRVRGEGTISAQNSLATASITNSLANQLSGTSSNGAAVSSARETMIPLDNVAKIIPTPLPLSISHHNGSYATTISFDLAQGVSYNDAVEIIHQTLTALHASDTIRGDFTGTAGETNTLMVNALLAFLAALAIMYITLGMLYESLIHPITILSTLPSAGVGAVLGLWVCGQSFSLIAIIGIILLTGIVKKNAILVIDFALHAQKEQNLSPRDAIYQASITRFRPILMTTLAAALGAIPLMTGDGYGCELRLPLGVSILGGMLISQLLTFYTTPIVYLFMEGLKARLLRLFSRRRFQSYSAS